MKTCAAPGCDATLGPRNSTGVCRKHNHAIGVCKCIQCRTVGRAYAEQLLIRRKITDEMLLDWVKRRAAGEVPTNIAPDMPDMCRTVTSRIRRQDIDMSREPFDVVAAAYW